MKRTAFTIVEFLVLIAIIAILVAMIIPAYYRARNGTPVKVVASTNALEKATDPGRVMTTTDPGPYDVRLLFMIDGLKVYRFNDGGHYIYVVDGRNSKTTWNESQRVGKMVVAVPQEVQTVR